MINGHGNNIYNYTEGEVEVDFSSNIAFNNRSNRIIEHLQGSISSIKNYPDPSASVLTAKIAAHHDVKPQEVLVVNGSAEAFYLVAHLLCSADCRTLIYTPAFAEYEDSCRVYNHNLHFEDIENFAHSSFGDFNSVWLGAPNNPNGYHIKGEDIVEKCHQYPNCYFVVDRAYNDLSNSRESDGETPQNLILINSLTKSFGIPGIRLGYVIACEQIIEKLQSMRPPWSVNSLSLLAGEYIMDNYSSLQPDIDELLAESRFLQSKIGEIDGFRVITSGCNFFLCEITNGRNAKQLHEYLIDNYGLLIRDASNFRDLSDKYFRVAAQCRSANEQLIEALKQWR